MADYHRISKQVSWALLVFTMWVVLLALIVLGFVCVLANFVRPLLVPGEPPASLLPALCMAAALVVPSLALVRFYYVVATRNLPPRRIRAGWLCSAAYHAALTVLFLVQAPGYVTIPSGVLVLQFPIALVSGAALAGSLYLLFRFPRPPRLPKQPVNP